MRLALVGNPNVGKTTLFNALTKTHQQVANWPGTTVEVANGRFQWHGREITVTDLPGTYGLSAYAEDERVARNFLLSQQPDVVVIVVDASALERNLYLVLETMELFPASLVALTKVDLAQSAGSVIDTEKLAQLLHHPVVPILPRQEQGLDALLATACEIAEGKSSLQPLTLTYPQEVAEAVEALQPQLAAVVAEDEAHWMALRLLSGDPDVLQRIEAIPSASRIVQTVASCCGASGMAFATQESTALDPAALLAPLAEQQAEYELAIADHKYEVAHRLAEACTQARATIRRRSITERLDAIFLHPIYGYLCLAVIFFAVFWISFEASAPLSDGLANSFTWLGQRTAEGLRWLAAPQWAQSLVIDGIFAGIGGVLSFVPYMALFFAAMTLLETTGYMARASLLADRFMQAIGLHGKSLFPLVSAFGCNVPALTATRTMENKRDRLVTNLVIPFIPCNARLGVMAVVSGAFFHGGTAGIVMLGLICISLAVVAGATLFYRKTVLRQESAPLLLELSPYTLPSWRDIALPTGQRVLGFVSRIWKFLLGATIVVWALTYFPIGAAPQDSLAGTLGGFLAGFGQWFGFDWRLMVAILFGFVAKETTLATLGVVYGMSEGPGLTQALTASMTPLVAFTFLVVYMLYVPCLSTVVQMHRETNSWKWTAIGILFNIVVAFTIGFVVEHIGLLLGFAM